MRGLMWFREDLRVDDNTALHHAGEFCTNGLVALYIINPAMWKAHEVAACRIDFILRGLKALSADLSVISIPLIVITVNSTAEIPSEIFKIMSEVKADTVFFNRQYEVNENKRDLAVQDFLNKKQIHFCIYDDQTILSPGTVTTKSGSGYKIFTPYKNAWYEVFSQQQDMKLFPRVKNQMLFNIQSSKIPDSIAGFVSNIDPDLWPSGEKEAQKRLDNFIKNHLPGYQKARDFPALNATSQLSPYLASGMISPRRCFLAALEANQNRLDSGKAGAVCWMTELIWREFYKYILIKSPRVSMSRPYKLVTEKIKWHFDEAKLIAWQSGKTGFPIIDAAMRQLNTTGWMHNRLRMIVAMFFSKNLFFDWRLGEKYFMNHLIDGDLAANNGGWQWCASTGTDAVPYFRIFNPTSQSQKFDPDGKFIRQYCPELAKLSNTEIHLPRASAIVDLKASRQHAINVFKSLQTE